MGEAGVNSLVVGERVDLSFAVELAKALREDNPVIVFVERGACGLMPAGGAKTRA